MSAYEQAYDTETRPGLRHNGRESARLAAAIARMTWSAAPGPVAGIVALAIVSGVLPLAQLVVAKAIVDRATASAVLAVPGDALATSLPIGGWIALAVTIVVVNALLEPVSRTLTGLVADQMTGRVTGRLLRAINRWRGLRRFEDPAFANDLKLANERAAGVGLDVTHTSADLLVTLATTTSAVLLLGGLHPLVPVLLVAASLPLIARTWDFGIRTGTLIYSKVPAGRRMEYDRDVLMRVSLAQDVRLFGMAPWFQRRYEREYAATYGELDRQRRGLVGGMTLASALSASSAAAVYVWLVAQVAGGDRPLGDVILYGGAATLFQGQLAQIGALLGRIPFTLQHIPAFGRITDAGPDLDVPIDPTPSPRPLRDGIRFEDVHFTYPVASEPTLRGVSFDIPAGSSVALVGLNGSGKTTIVKLLTRLYDPTAGRITLDGVDLRHVDLDAHRRDIAVTFQDYVRYDLTVADNIAVGDLSARGDEPRLLAAARLSGADEVIDRLPEGLATVLGREFGTHDLSEGQWQRLALARAFVRDAGILVLDEPTAALDVRTEAEVYRRFAELTRGRTTLLISHRLSAVRLADQILFLEDGRIAERGDHAGLMALGGRYARLYRLQAAHYGIDPAAGDEGAAL